VALGEIYIRQGRLGDAESQFITVVNSGANKAAAYLGLAHVSRAISYYARERRLLDKAHELDPADPEILREWLDTLAPPVRQDALKDYLSNAANDDAGTRAWVAQELAAPDDPSVTSHPCRMISAQHASEIDLQKLYDDNKVFNALRLRVAVNGVAANLLVDTGAYDVLISKRIAEKARVTKSFATQVPGFGDKKAAHGYVGHVDSLQIGEMEFHDCDVEVAEKGLDGRDGIIGPVVFSEFLVDMDTPHAKLRLSELPPRPRETPQTPTLESGSRVTPASLDRYMAPQMKGYTPVFRFDHILPISTRVNETPPRLFMLDTGAFTSIITPAAARELTKVSNDNDVEVEGLSGRVAKVYRGGELTLTFAGLRQTNLDILSIDETNFSQESGTEISGTLGFPLLVLLDRKIDHRDGLVSFKFDRPPE
jgi:hypothetical protein